MNASTMIDTVKDRWNELRRLADELGPDALEQETPSGWTAKEMLAHVAFWQEAAVYVIEHMLRGKPDPTTWMFPSGYDPFAVDEDWPSDLVHNAREAAWARTQDSTAVLDRLDRAHDGLLDVLATVTDVEVAASEDYYGEIHGHLAEHLEELRTISDSA